MYATSHRVETPDETRGKENLVENRTLMLVDGESQSTKRIQGIFERHHITCLVCTNLSQAFDLLQKAVPIDAVLVDLNLPNGDGIEVIRKVAKCRPQTPCIVLSAKNDIQSVVLAMKAGAIEYLTKPCSQAQLSSAILHAIANHQRQAPTMHAGPTSQPRWQSPAMRQAMSDARDAAKTDSPVLITGPAGSGKKSVAWWIHLKSSRSKSCFVSIDASHTPASRVEQELFGKTLSNHNGHTIAGTPPKIEACKGGTLYIENIQCLSSKAQEQLLEWLTKNLSAPNEQSCRLITSMTTLGNEPPQSKLRHDLWYAITVYHVAVPGLAQRSQDIPLLCEKLISHLCTTRHLRVPTITSKAMEILCDHEWPGNIEELHSILEHAITHTHDRLIGPSDLAYLNKPSVKRSSDQNNLPDRPESIEALTKASLINALDACQGNRRRVAKRLNISLRTVYNMINRYGLPKKQPGKTKQTQ